MNRSRLSLAASLLITGFSAQLAFAQSDGSSATPLPEQNLSEPAQTLTNQEDPIASDGVDVSLGDWDVKTEISKQLDLSISDVPLTVSVEPDLASQICPVRESDLEQQEIVSAVRTCAAKSVTDDLLEAVKMSLEQPEAEELDLAPISNEQSDSGMGGASEGAETQTPTNGSSDPSNGN